MSDWPISLADARERIIMLEAEIERLRQQMDGQISAQYAAELGRQFDEMETENERLRAGLQQIESWSRAYPLEMFPEPDFEKAHRLLQAGGMPLDAISAAAMRHVVEGVGAIARRALGEKT
jgi:hypothetical protein